jgi:hypothetical protein
MRQLVPSTLLIVLLLLVHGEGTSGAAGNSSFKPTTRTIDRQVSKRWRKARITPAPPANDYQFVRRVTLDLVGRVPTAGEVVTYVGDKSRRRKEKLVNRLLASDDYAEHWASVYADVLYGRKVRTRQRIAGPASDYLLDAFTTNKPFDDMTRELLTASGSLDDNPAGAYVMAQIVGGGDIEKVAGHTARVFLGVQIQCAQCHDHPYESRLKHSDFVAFTAFFGRTRARRGQAFDIRDDMRVISARRMKRKDEIIKKRPRLRYAFEEPLFFGRSTTPKAEETRREQLARAILSSDLFAKATVSRTWQSLFGSSIDGPWDDLGYENHADHSPLLVALAKRFEKTGYDHKLLLKAIVLSKAYARSSKGGRAASGGALEDAFARAAVRPLTADQLFRSQLAATGLEGAAGRTMRRRKLERRKRQALREFLFTFGDEEMSEADSFSGNVPQALLLRNGALTNLGAKAGEGMVLRRILDKSSDREQRLEWMWLATYARKPTATERAQFGKHLADHSDSVSAYEDLLHALLTSTEFTTNH